MIRQELKQVLIDLAKEFSPVELCCLIFGEDLDIFEVVRNTSETPTENFRVSQADISRLVEKHGPLAAFVHSHPNGNRGPSGDDMRTQMAWEIPFGVLTLKNGGFVGLDWFGDQCPKRPLEEREFIHGVCDCYALVRDWYAEQGVELPDFPRDDEWWLNGERLFAENFDAAGFVPVLDGSLQPGDVLVMNLRHEDPPSHCGVYIGDELILHHLPSRASRKDVAHMWVRRAETVYRLKERPE